MQAFGIHGAGGEAAAGAGANGGVNRSAKTKRASRKADSKATSRKGEEAVTELDVSRHPSEGGEVLVPECRSAALGSLLTFVGGSASSPGSPTCQVLSPLPMPSKI